jgi:D-alanyl-D-alanine carboxypeptidase
MAFDFVYPTPLPSTKGWGPGWPDCQTDKMVPSALFVPSLHVRIKPLVDMLVAELRGRGFDFISPGCWGFGCRGTKNSAGNISSTPSFHSWGLALDINAPLNPFGVPRLNTQLGKPDMAWVIDLMRDWGFFWLGPSIGDWMHFSFCGSPQDATDLIDKARKVGLGVMLTPAQAKAIERADNFVQSVIDGLSAATGAGAGARVATATAASERGHNHDTGTSVPAPAAGGPRAHDHGKTGKT